MSRFKVRKRAGTRSRGGCASASKEGTDACDAGRSRGQTDGGVLPGNSSEREHRNLLRDGAGECQSLESRTGGNEFTVDALFEDRAEEDEVCGVVAGSGDVGRCMAGDADDRCGKTRVREQLAHLRWRQLLRM